MSQHYFSTSHEGRPVTVVVGYDRPLRGFFCFVERNDSGDDEDGDEFVYSNLEDPQLVPSFGFAKELKHFRKRLGDLGLKVPESLFEQSEADQRGNVGNRYARHEADGTFA